MWNMQDASCIWHINRAKEADMKKPDTPTPTSMPASGHINLKITAEFLGQVDAWRRSQPDLPNRTEAIWRMVAIAYGVTDSK